MAALSRLRQPKARRKGRRKGPRKGRRATLFERCMAAIALVNLMLVLFDLSYIRFRDLYLQVLPAPTVWYGERFKGIEPERTTVKYLALVDDLEQQLVKGSSAETNSPTTRRLLAQLREQSESMVDEDPFAVAGKSGTLERIKNLMRDRLQEDSSKAAFRRFWSEAYLQAESAETELAFFDEEVRPLMETNYFRGISESGRPIDLFWQIDLAFMILFAAEFLARTYVLSRRHPSTSWIDAMLWRIYDVPLFLGFWRWLRVIPVTLRLHQARWVNLEPVRNRLSRAFVSQFAVELTEIVLLRSIDQIQRLIRDGDISRWLIAASDRSRYVDINGIDEIQTIAKHLSDIVVYKVLPDIRPELDALLQHSVVSALHQAPAYQGLKLMPGFDLLSAQISQQVVTELSKTLTNAIQHAFADKEGGALTGQLIASFGEHLRIEVQNAETLAEIQGLINDLLEEIKINYVEKIATEDAEQLEASRYQLYGVTRRPR
ncbi:MAG: hypothetical protein WBC73_20530 [Phormidesmis sp.]